jgi:hypothetical protein
MLMANNKNADFCAGASIDQGVRETSEGETAPAPSHWRAETGVGNQQNCHTFKFRKECARQTDSTLLPIELKGFLQLCNRFGMKRVRH